MFYQVRRKVCNFLHKYYHCATRICYFFRLYFFRCRNIENLHPECLRSLWSNRIIINYGYNFALPLPSIAIPANFAALATFLVFLRFWNEEITHKSCYQVWVFLANNYQYVVLLYLHASLAIAIFIIKKSICKVPTKFEKIRRVTVEI